MSEATQRKLTCAIGIATYQRHDILRDALRCLLLQTRLPDEIFIGDASPNAEEAAARIRQDMPELDRLPHLQHFQAPRGSSVQRNHILDRAASDVTLFLDDDSMAAPEYVANLMAVYEADTAEQVGGVEGLALEGEAARVSAPAAPAPSPPPRKAKEKLRDWAAGLAQGAQGWFKTHYVGDYFPEEYVRPVHGVPVPLQGLPVTPVRSLYGCVMSFRTPIARIYRFNEHLKLYAYMEDFELSYRIGTKYALLKCLNAPARHLRMQGGRLHHSVIEYLVLINLAFIARTAMDWGPTLRRHLERYARRAMHMELALGCVRKGGFQKYRALKAGRQECQAIFDARNEDLAQVYAQAAQKGFAQQAF
jgi:GT2 family glycosyltransferase